jgi:hemerythrin-like domain-containing protein
MDLWQMVVADHANIRELCREVLHATGGGPNSRSHLFEVLDGEIERHFKAEESVLFPAYKADERTRDYVSELERDHEEIRGRLGALAARPDKNSRSWALNFNELASTIKLHFSLEENGVLAVARRMIDQDGTQALRRAFERRKIAALQADRWHLPAALAPGRYGLSPGVAVAALAGIAAVWTAALMWRLSHQSATLHAPLRPVRRRPEPPFPLLSRVVTLGPRTAEARDSTMPQHERGEGLPGTVPPRPSNGESPNHWFSSANPPRAPSGIGSGLQPSGTVPGGGPAASVGSIGTGAAQTENRGTGSLGRDGR